MDHQNIEFYSRLELETCVTKSFTEEAINYNSHRSANSPALDQIRPTKLCRLTFFHKCGVMLSGLTVVKSSPPM